MDPALVAGGKPYTPKEYDLHGGPFSEELIDTHIGLYQGYVKHTNKAVDLLRSDLEPYQAGEIRRRFAWEFNGMRLHELYFDGMVPGGSEGPEGALRDAISHEFGSFDAWHEDFLRVGGTRGIGWAALTHDAAQKRLFNVWINEHDAGALVGTQPLLLMDVFEHAFMRDFGTDRAAYMDAFFSSIDWDTVSRRLA